MVKRIVIVVQQESLRERPRIHKLARVLAGMEASFEIWKFGDSDGDSCDGIAFRNLLSSKWLKRPAPVRYLAWMIQVYIAAWHCRREARFFAVGFDSAAPIACLPLLRPAFIFDNIDNVSMSYRWPTAIRAIFRFLEGWVARRAQIHVNPSRGRWSAEDDNLRIVANTPSREMLTEAATLARARDYGRGHELTLYLNGWLSSTRGIRTLVRALAAVRHRGRIVRVLVAGRASCEDARDLLAMEGVEHLGMLTNAEALATYYRSDLAFIYYDPEIEINRLAESQKWTDCWATGTPFVSNLEVQTLAPYLERSACFALAYDDVDGLAGLLESLADDPTLLKRVRDELARMDFKFWDDEMRLVMRDWLAADAAHGLAL